MEESVKNEEKQCPEESATQNENNPETESLTQIKTEGEEEKNGEKEKTESSETKQEETEEQSSPRGILEAPVSGSDSDQSSGLGSRSSSFGSEKLPTENPGEINYGYLQWKKMLSQIKRRSMRRFSIIPLLPFLGANEMSKKALKKLGKNGAVESIDCGDFVVPKPSWRNFSYEELKQATDNFSPGIFYILDNELPEEKKGISLTYFQK